MSLHLEVAMVDDFSVQLSQTQSYSCVRLEVDTDLSASPSSVQWSHHSATSQDPRRATQRQVCVPGICLSTVFLGPRLVMLALIVGCSHHTPQPEGLESLFYNEESEAQTLRAPQTQRECPERNQVWNLGLELRAEGFVFQAGCKIMSFSWTVLWVQIHSFCLTKRFL